MAQISKHQLLNNFRNSVIEMLELYSSFDNIIKFGAFEALNWYDDILPISYHEAPKVFSEEEKWALAHLSDLVDLAADTTVEDSWDIKWFAKTSEWRELCLFSQKALNIFLKRGKSREDAPSRRYH